MNISYVSTFFLLLKNRWNGLWALWWRDKLWSYVPGIKSSLIVSAKCSFLPVIELKEITRYKYCTYVLRITLTQVYWIVLPYYIFEVPTDNTINSTCCFLNIINSNRNKQRLLNYQNRTVDILSITQQH